jgi:DNA-binding Lrp family transcriptional regulator
MPLIKVTEDLVLTTLIRSPALSIAELTEKLGVSEQTIRRHLARLSETGAVSRQTVVAPGWLGLKFLMTFLLQVEDRCLTAVADGLAAADEIHYASIAVGGFDLIAQGHFHSNAHLIEFIEHGLGQLGGIRAVERVRHLRMIKLAFGVETPIERLAVARQPAGPRYERFVLADRNGHGAPAMPDDAVDEALIRAIGSGTRPATRRLAEELGLSESTITRRLAKLTAQGAIVDLLILHPDRLGFPLGVSFFFRAHPHQFEETVAALAALPELTALSQVAGESDLAATGYFQSDEHLAEFLAGDLSAIRGLAARRVSPIIRTVKSLYGGVPVLPPDALLRPRPLLSVPLL